jgi:hypothetical protein
MQDPTTVANFLSALGSSIVYGDDTDTSGNSCDLNTGLCTPGNANVAADLGAGYHVALTATLSGGTSVWRTGNGNVAVAVEQIGAGFLFVSGDSNYTECDLGPPIGGYSNCSFLKRLYDYGDEDII